jgi:lysyl-tRNA synthetase class 2
MTLVESSNIKSIDYIPKTKTLIVEFHSGRSYHYSKVPSTIHEEFINSDSKGRYFNQNILGKYEATRMT